ncbi:hypothetical protein PG637_06090 [Riemerella anatipestifer]|nr:hypothetical protein [Riemerella anatipestifer]MDY3325242.1 hypothetical protein [Riemerella anatipestifer]MDY3352768.1 hypothetical protein [Riemerella anatipestifer]
MKTPTLLLIPILFLFGSLYGQNDDEKINTLEERDTFDLAFYEMVRNKINFKQKNGNIIEYIDFVEKEGGEIREFLAPPSFLIAQKKYYPNRKIKSKSLWLPGIRTKIGISEYYDEQGNKTIVDEDKKFGKIKYTFILDFLEEKGYINQKTGEGRYTDKANYREAFIISYFENINLWVIRITNGKPNEGPISGRGEPPAYLPIYFYIDGDSGEVMPDGEFDRRENSAYKTYNGKKYSY